MSLLPGQQVDKDADIKRQAVGLDPLIFFHKYYLDSVLNLELLPFNS